MHARPARLAPMAKLPVFLDLAGKRAVVAGEGAPVVWKAELLAASGACVTVCSSEPDRELLALAEASPEITLVRRRWTPTDMKGTSVAVADTADEEEADRFAAAARAYGALVNVIDKPAFCDFQFGAIVNRSPVVIGISTDGAAPILAQAVRRRIEALVPRSVASWAAAAKAFRGGLSNFLSGKAELRRFWEAFADGALSRPQVDDLEQLARGIRAGSTVRGEVVLVGAGPGDPELLTLSAVRELQAADVILYDRLVPEGVLELGRREAERIAVGKEGHGPSCRQDDINALAVSLALQGRRVVRLKGGDPAIFARTGEEVDACRRAAIPVRIVPGVTAATAAAAALGVSLTHRDHAHRVQFVTGHGRSGALPGDIDLDAVADPRATTVVYMARRTAAELAGKLIGRGLSAATPAAVASNVSRSDEAIVPMTLGDLAESTAVAEEVGPSLVVIGSVCGAAAVATARAPGPERVACSLRA